MTAYLLLFAIVLGVNLLPAFGPPTWSIIVLFGINTHLPLPAIVGVGAVAAALGRFTLAHATRWCRRWLSEKTRRNVEAVREAFERKRHRGWLALLAIAFLPLPSAQLFEAAGLTGMKLLPFTAAFFAGRVVSYSIYAGGAKAAQHSSLAGEFRHVLTSPVGIGVQVLMLAGLVALAKVDWAKRLKR